MDHQVNKNCLEINKAKELYKSAFKYNSKNWQYYYTKRDEMAFKTDNDNLIFVFNGSGSDLKEWISNLKLKKVKREKSKLHKGFVESAESFKEIIEEILNKNKQKNIRLITYSRGIIGLLAFAKIIKYRKDIILNVHTFGAPKIGDVILEDDDILRTNIFITNVVLRGDLIHLLPPIFTGYKKNIPGKTYYFGSKLNWIWPRISIHLKYFSTQFLKEE